MINGLLYGSAVALANTLDPGKRGMLCSIMITIRAEGLRPCFISCKLETEAWLVSIYLNELIEVRRKRRGKRISPPY